MDLSPPPGQQELRDGLAALLASFGPSDWERRIASEPGYDPLLWSALVSGGWVTHGFPQAAGGAGGGVGDLVVVAETLGGGPVPTPLQGGIVLCGQALLATPGEGDRLQALLAGERTFTYCNWEGFEEGSERQSTVVATETGRGWRVDGSARFVPFGAEADELLVMADVRDGGTPPGPTLFAVPGSSSGLTTQLVPTVGGDRCCHVTFSGVEVDASHLVGQLGQATQWLPRVLAIGRVVLAAEMVGAAAAALSHATRWATTRVQFHAPIGSLQAIQHRLADAYIDVVTAQDSVYDAAGVIDRGDEARLVAAAAKAHCSDACRRVTGAAHQVCGGEGIYADQPLHLWHRRIAALVPVLGTVRSLRALVAGSILPIDGSAPSLLAEPSAR
jgi:alkylation response protein AidB-like acyl-CoA dehydrogenase